MNYLALPDVILLEEILPKLSLEHLNKLCSTNVRLRNICLNDRLWQIKTQKEYPSPVIKKLPNGTWKEYYTYLSTLIRKISVTYYIKSNSWKEGKFPVIGEVNLTEGSTIESLTDEIINLAREKDHKIYFRNSQYGLIAISNQPLDQISTIRITDATITPT